MAFCTNCGSPVTGQFCTKCGARAGAPGPAAAPPSPSAAGGRPVNIAAGVPPPTGARKRGPLFWVLAGCLGIVVIGAIVVVVGWIFVVNKAKQAGIDPALMQKNPGLAVAKMIAAMNPDIEILGVDEDRGVIRVRDKKDGKILTVNLAEAKNGRIVFEDEKHQRVELEAKGEGDEATLAMRTPEGSILMGPGAAQLPDWLPSYPGAEIAGALAGMQRQEGQSAAFAFRTEDSPEEVAAFYSNALMRAGFEVAKASTAGGIMVTAKQSSSGRSAHITAAREAGKTVGQIILEDKNKNL